MVYVSINIYFNWLKNRLFFDLLTNIELNESNRGFSLFILCSRALLAGIVTLRYVGSVTIIEIKRFVLIYSAGFRVTVCETNANKTRCVYRNISLEKKTNCTYLLSCIVCHVATLRVVLRPRRR